MSLTFCTEARRQERQTRQMIRAPKAKRGAPDGALVLLNAALSITNLP